MSESTPPSLWRETPLIHSNHISNILGRSAFLKLENLQPSQSFKYRGISHFVQKAQQKHGPSLHLVIASGGNAGFAAACAAHAVGVRCTVYIPEGVAEQTLQVLKGEGAEVVVVGKIYAEALEIAKRVVKSQGNAVMVPSYDDPIVWEGHSSMVTEISTQLNKKPDAIFCSVGGGGLLGGIILGCEDVGWDDVPIIAVETIGSNCFYHSVSLNSGQCNSIARALPQGVDLVEENGVLLANFNGFSSKASGSLGASQPAAEVVKMALVRKGGVRCVSVPDELSMQAAGSFADDHKFLVELACSTTLTAAYKPSLMDKLVPTKPDSEGGRPVVFIVCGGFKVTLEDMAEYRSLVEADLKDGEGTGGCWDVLCDGETWKVEKMTRV